MGLSMINIENELTVLDINKSEFINKLERLGATKVTDELLQQKPLEPVKEIVSKVNKASK